MPGWFALYVVGSAVTGERRNIGRNFPLGKNPETEKSDIDYAITFDDFVGLRQHLKLPFGDSLVSNWPLAQLPDVSPHEILRHIPWKPFIRFQPHRAPEILKDVPY
jgi:hypothetical protein